MKRGAKLILALGAIILYLGVTTANAQTSKNIVEQRLTAVAENSFESYLALGTDWYKEKIKKEDFKKVVEALQERIKSGYKLEFLGTLKASDKEMIWELWKVSFSNGEPDVLVRVLIKDNKFQNFWWHW